MSEVEVVQMIKDYSDSIFDWSIISFLYGAVAGFGIYSLIDVLFDLLKNRKKSNSKVEKQKWKGKLKAYLLIMAFMKMAN